MHYGVAVVPARVPRPRDKAKSRWVCRWWRGGSWRGCGTQAIGELLVRLNERPFHKLPARADRYSRTWSVRRYAHCLRSASPCGVEEGAGRNRPPRRDRRQQLDVRVTANRGGDSPRAGGVASHLRSFRRGFHTTQSEHMCQRSP